MANAAGNTLSTRITSGAVITKYGHSRGPIGPLQIFEAGHPVPDEAGLRAAQAALELTRGLREEDCVLFLISGGGSALFESPLVPLAELEDITGQLLSCGADIVEINTIRKRLSAVKGGRFALHCRPAPVCSGVLADILGDPLDMSASGPAAPDSSTCAEALAVVRKYGLRLSDRALACLQTETPKALPNAVSRVTGSVRALCDAAEQAAQTLGYRCIRLTDCLSCEAREAGRFLAAVARTHAWRDGRASDRLRTRRTQSGGCTGRCGRTCRACAGRRLLLRLRRDRRPDRRRRRLCRSGQLRRAPRRRA